MRDDFTRATVERLAKRAGYRCSNPHCRAPTIGAAQGDDGVVNVGQAAHITAAAAGGPRYDATLSSEQRRDQSNGIWLCQNHAKLVDNDVGRFTVAKLREWKREAEKRSFMAVLSGQGTPGVQALPSSDIDQLVERLRRAAVDDLAGFMRAPSWPSHPISLSLRLASDDSPRQFNAKTIGTAVSAFNELVIVAPPGMGEDDHSFADRRGNSRMRPIGCSFCAVGRVGRAGWFAIRFSSQAAGIRLNCD